MMMMIKVVLLYSLWTLTFTSAAEHQTLRLDDKNLTDVKLSSGSNLSIGSKNNSTSRRNGPKNTQPEPTNKVSQQGNNQISMSQTVTHKDDGREETRQKREPFGKAEESANINSYLHMHDPQRSKGYPLSAHQHNPTILGNSRHSDSPGAIILHILRSSSKKNGNKDFKNLGLTKTVAYNVTKLVDSDEERSFLLEKRENLTVERSYLDSKERETKYSETRSSKIHKVLGPEIFEEEWASEEDVEKRTQEENTNNWLSRSNKFPSYDVDGNVKSSVHEPSSSDYAQRGSNEFVDGTYVDKGFRSSFQGPHDPVQITNLEKTTQSITNNDIESGDLLGQPNGVIKVYPTDLMPDLTILDFKQLIEEVILDKGYTESPTTTPVQGTDEQNNGSNDFGTKRSTSDETSTRQQAEYSSTEVVTALHYPEGETLNLTIENPETKASSDLLSNDKDIPPNMLDESLTVGNDAVPIIIKHGDSIILDPNGDDTTNISRTTSQNEATPLTSESYNDLNSRELVVTNKTEEITLNADKIGVEQLFSTPIPGLEISQPKALSETLSTLSFDESEYGRQEKENNGLDEYTQSILEVDPQTEEASTEILDLKGEIETSGSNNLQTSLSSDVKQETSKSLGETAIKKGQNLEQETTETNLDQINEPIIDDSAKEVESDEDNDDGYEESKPKLTFVDVDKIPSTTEEVRYRPTDSTPIGITGSDIIVGVPTGDVDVTGEYSNLDPSNVKLDESNSLVPLQRGDINIHGSTLSNEIERGDPIPLHVVELFGGQGKGKGQQVQGHRELENSRPSSVHESKIPLEDSTEESLTELCFSLKNEKEVSLWDLVAGKLYLENEGKRILLNIDDKPLERCNSGTIKCKLPFSFDNPNESLKGTDSSQEGVDETDINYTAKVSKRHIIENESNENEPTYVKIPDRLITDQTNSYINEKETKFSREALSKKQLMLTDLLLILLTNETYPNINFKTCNPAGGVANPGQADPTADDKSNPQPNLTLVSLFKKVDNDQNKVLDSKTASSSSSPPLSEEERSRRRVKRALFKLEDSDEKKEGGCGCGSMLGRTLPPFRTTTTSWASSSSSPPLSEGERSRRRVKRTLFKLEDSDEKKEGGCGCGSLLGRTLPPIPNHDHFLGKRLNIITSIAHAIKDWAITRPVQ